MNNPAKQLISRRIHMKLLTVDLKKKFARIGSQQGVEDPVIITKYFMCYINWTFYATEFDPSNELFTGIAQWLVTEWGYISLYHIESLRGPGGIKAERDKHFKSLRMSELHDLKKYYSRLVKMRS